ncbi:MAG: FAD-dependent monooxygenase [Chloroflexi bacterium]|nr:FAD-dependent monooxygenase [Chloroflexota bacterium]
MDSYDVIIVGSGPAGTSTALHLLHRNPAWAARILILEKARHPRPKICGGALTEWGERPLRDLGLRVTVPHVEVREARFTFGGLSFSYWGKPVIRVTRRDEFDDWLCRLVKEKGVRVNEGEAVVDVRLEKDGVRVTTTRGEYCAEALVGADGSKGLVRRKLGLKDERRIARLLEVLTPEDPNRAREFVDARANFDFTPLASGMQGYYWDFPSWVRGRAFMNRGVYDSRADADALRAALKTILAEQMARWQRAMDAAELHGHPIHWFDPRAPLSPLRPLRLGGARPVAEMADRGDCISVEAKAASGETGGEDRELGHLACPVGESGQTPCGAASPISGRHCPRRCCFKMIGRSHFFIHQELARLKSN